MKVIELMAERAKIIFLLEQKQYYMTANRVIFFGQEKEADEYCKISDKAIKEAYEESIKLLRKLDAINNTLFESDSKTYLDVQGNYLSVSTARKYIQELTEFEADDQGQKTFKDFSVHSGFENMRWRFYENCMPSETEKVLKDPLNLKERREEFQNKQLDWKLQLRTAVSISDATTEVSFGTADIL